jgi:hypothetical protein
MKTLAELKDRNEILERLARVRPDSARKWGRMTASQMICHLSDSYEAAMGEKPVSMVASPLPRVLVKWIALYAPFHWPQGVPTRPEMDQNIGGTQPVDFDQDRAKLTTMIERFCDPGRESWGVHPMFGHISAKDWLRWGYLHADHHLRQFGC